MNTQQQTMNVRNVRTGLLLFGGLLSMAGLAGSGIHAQAEEPSASVTLQAGTWKDVEAIVAAHPGKIVIVDIWSMSCLPCIAEFPNLVELHKQDPKDFVCVSFNVDYVGIKSKPPESYRSRVEGFLKKQQATFTNILCTQESDAVFKQLKLTSIPAVYVYGRDGQLAKRFDDSLFEDGEEEAFTYEADINPFLKTLKQKP